MTKQQSQVREMMQKFGQKTPERPTMPDFETRLLRCKLILEEAQEFFSACGFMLHVTCIGNLVGEPLGRIELVSLNSTPDLEMYADATADLRVVVEGADVAAGIDGEPIFEVVHASNMSKIWTPEECLTLPRNEGLRVTAAGDTADDGYVVKNEAGKFIKSPGYIPAHDGIVAELERQSQ